MNAKSSKGMTLLAAVLISSVLYLEESAWAQSNCKAVQADIIEVAGAAPTASGTVTNGGDLNGTSALIFNSGASPTPAPTTVSFTGDFTLTTNQGQLKTSNVYLYDSATGLITAMGRINSITSTGRFTGATGVLFFNGKTINFSPFIVKSNITGEICFGRQ